MTQGPKKDLARSIRQRLQNKAQATGRPFQEIFQYFVMERFLYRVCRSRHADNRCDCCSEYSTVTTFRF